jgi:hypothetical protein
VLCSKITVDVPNKFADESALSDALDTDGDGSVSLAELQRMLVDRLGLPLRLQVFEQRQRQR